ncbi:hypothetical protein [Nakamurella sp.]|uniref:hypothetical protein n=1 Tax=Nakamurella sp. TaxID=1869182 RepID=UPI003B3B696D
MTDLTPRDIAQLDQAAVDALSDVDALAADPETTRRLAERGEAVYGFELTRDLQASLASDWSLASWAAFATIRLAQARAEVERLRAQQPPATPAVVGDIDLAGWCAKAAADYHDFEQHEMAMYPDDDSRDRALVEWVVRVLGNPAQEASRDVLAVLATRHHDEVVSAGTVDWLKGRVAELAAERDRLREQAFAQKPVIAAVEAWAELVEADSSAPAHASALATLHQAVEQYRLMDLALTNARAEAADR